MYPQGAPSAEGRADYFKDCIAKIVLETRLGHYRAQATSAETRDIQRTWCPCCALQCEQEEARCPCVRGQRAMAAEDAAKEHTV